MDQSGICFARSGRGSRHLADLPLSKAHKPGSRETASGLFVCAFRFHLSQRARPAKVPEFFNNLDAIPGPHGAVHGVPVPRSVDCTHVVTVSRFGFAGVARRSSTSLPMMKCRFDSDRPHQTTAHAPACVAVWTHRLRRSTESGCRATNAAMDVRFVPEAPVTDARDVRRSR